MPSVSRAQHALMAMSLYSPSKLRGKAVPKKVAAEFMKADRGKHFAKRVKRIMKRKRR